MQSMDSRLEQLEHKDQSHINLSPDDICQKMGNIPFYCGDNTKHETNLDYHNDFCCTMHVARLPVHPATKKEMPPTPYQLEFVEAIMKAVTKPQDMSQENWDRLEHMFHVLKGRQMGFTEIVLRVIFHFCFSRYAGSKVGIIAAVNGKLANKNLRRFMQLFIHIKSVVPNGIKSSVLTIINGTTIEAFPASEEAMTGDTKYACIFMDESAKWKLVDDTPVFNSVMPIIRSNGADLFLVSTFKGPIKMFYKIWNDKDPDFMFLEYTIERTVGNLYTAEQVDKMISSSTEDPDQEYMCIPSSGRDSIFGAVKSEDQQGMTEWLVEDTPEKEDVEWDNS